MTEHIKESIENAVSYLSAHPDESRYTDSAAVAVLDDGLRCRVIDDKGHEVVTDMPDAVGGGGTAPSPGWMSRAALAACDATLIAMRAAQLGVALSKLEVTVDSVSDDRGLLGMDDSIPAGPLTTRVVVRISAPGADEQQLKQIVDWAHHHSPVGDGVCRAIPTEVQTEIV